ncbi:hypothetical protein AB9M10_12700 [Rhodococcus erythropolis]
MITRDQHPSVLAGRICHFHIDVDVLEGGVRVVNLLADKARNP